MKRIFFCFLTVFSCLSLWGKIVEINNIEEVYNYLTPNDLVIFDIDNTLVEPVQTMGSNQWFEYLKKKYLEEKKSPKQAFDKAYKQWLKVQNVTEFKLVEEEKTRQLISNLQKKKQEVMGLTTRGLCLSCSTIDRLKQLGIYLEKTAPSKKSMFFLNPLEVLYSEGILFTNGTNKETVFLQFFSLIGKFPSSVIFINDNKKHLEQVEKACEKKKISFIGLRYGYLDEKVKNFRADIAEKQYEEFDKILSDKEAETKLKQKK